MRFGRYMRWCAECQRGVVERENCLPFIAPTFHHRWVIPLRDIINNFHGTLGWFIQFESISVSKCGTHDVLHQSIQKVKNQTPGMFAFIPESSVQHKQWMRCLLQRNLPPANFPPWLERASPLALGAPLHVLLLPPPLCRKDVVVPAEICARVALHVTLCAQYFQLQPHHVLAVMSTQNHEFTAFVRNMAAAPRARRRASCASQHSQTNGTVDGVFGMWWVSSAGVITSLSSMKSTPRCWIVYKQSKALQRWKRLALPQHCHHALWPSPVWKRWL